MSFSEYRLSDGQPAPLFTREGNIWQPQEAGIGPWAPDALHGGPVAALCVALAEELTPGDDLVTTRLSLDLVRPVLTRPIKADARILKSGRRVHLIEIELQQDERTVALARAQRTAHSKIELPDLTGTGLNQSPPPDAPAEYQSFDASLAPRPPAPFMRMATEFRTRSPQGLYERGKKFAWLRVYANLLPGVPLSNAAAVYAAADYTNALGAPMMPVHSPVLFANADLSVHLVRVPVSKWARLEPASTWQDHGIGHTRCEMWDEQGLLGTSAVTLPLVSKG